MQPKMLTVLREGYTAALLRADFAAAVTVAIVALPLSMAIAIASGVEPERGLYAAIIGGFLISLLGGSRFQIGGPAGAFIVLVATTAATHGIEGLLLVTLMSGVLMMLLGLLRQPGAADSSSGRDYGLHRRHCPHHSWQARYMTCSGCIWPAREPAAFVPKLQDALACRCHLQSAPPQQWRPRTVAGILLLRRCCAARAGAAHRRGAAPP